MNIVYPTGAFTPAGGPVINIKSTTRFTPNAVGDGVTDDTAAFVAMMDYLNAELAIARSLGRRFTPWIIYVPTGTYIVSNTIYPTTGGTFTGLNLIGQNRANTIIKLKDNSAGFGVGTKKPVLQYSDPANSPTGQAWGNELRNLTINTGSGNPGAVGVIFLGANTCNLDNLTVTSGDGFGDTGLSFPTWSVQGHFSDITITGFDYGVGCDIITEQNPAFEYMTLSGQKKAGIYVGGSHPTIRKLLSNNSVPAIRIEGTGAHVVITDSTLTGTGAAGSAAIRMNETAAGSATLTSGWEGRARDNLGVAAVDNWKVTTTPAGGSPTVVTNETFNTGSAITSQAQFESVFAAGNVVSNKWNYASAGGAAGGGVMNAPGGQIVSNVHKGSYAGFQTGTTITLSFDANMRGTGVSTNSIVFKAFLKDLPVLGGISGLDFQCDYVSGATVNKYAIRANGVLLGNIDLAASIANNSYWYYRWTASWTRLASGNYDLTLRLEDIGAGGGVAPVLVQTWTRTNFAPSIKSQLFARNVISSGYTSTIEIDNQSELTGNIGYDFISGGTYRLQASSPLVSMNLPVEEGILVPWESNPANWATPEDYTGTTIQKIQAAMNSGKPAVCFPRAYSITDSAAIITIPATVRQIDWMGQQKHTFNCTFEPAASANPLWIEHASGNARLRMTSNRTIYARTGDLRVAVTTTSPINIHYANMYLNEGSLDTFCPPNAKIYARCINQENSSTFNFVVNGGTMRVMGFKTEQSKDCFYVKNGGYLEVLGGYRNLAGQTNSGRPWVFNDDSNVSVIGTTFGQQAYTDAIWEKRGATTFKYFPADLPSRQSGFGSNYSITHYSGYAPLAQLLNPGFETPALASGFQYNPTGAIWTFAGSSGVQRSGWSATTAPEGVQTAFLQSNTAGSSISQSVTTPAGTYVLSFRAARRLSQVQPIQVRVNGVAVGGPITPASSSFTSYTTPSFTLTAGSHTIRFETTVGTGDVSTFVDQVALTPWLAQLLNSGFETPALASGFQYNPTGANWTFAGSSGVQRSGWSAATAPEGVQTAFLQSNTAGSSISQSVATTAGTYILSFRAARRLTQVQPIQVRVNGVAVGSPITPASSSFASYTTPPFTLSTGTHTIRFETTVGTGDVSSFIDQVTLTP